jgi:DedD protein
LTDSDEATELRRRARRRLVGAIALVVLAVIVLPIIFDKEPKPVNQDIVIQIPSQNAGRFNSKVLPPPRGGEA